MSGAARNGAGGNGGNRPNGTLRIDKWLWQARFFKSRSLANAMVAAGRLRVNSQPIAKAHYQIRPGDVLTFPQGRRIRVIEVAAIGTRRGPAAEAQTLYADLAPPEPRSKDDAPAVARPAERERGAGRPTKKERRETDRLRGEGDAVDGAS